MEEIRYKTFAFKAQTLEEPNMFAGYASTFGLVDRVGEVVMKGAFKASLPAFLESGLVCWQHDWEVPIGKCVDAHEDKTGLFVKARVSDTTAGRDAMTLLRDGVVTKMSIGYSVDESATLSEEEAVKLLGHDGYVEALKHVPPWNDGIIALKAVTLYEFSPVSVPANTNAVITTVKRLLDRGSALSDTVDTAMTLNIETVSRFEDMIAQRGADDRQLSPHNLALLNAYRASAHAMLTRVDQAIADATKSAAIADDERRTYVASYHAHRTRRAQLLGGVLP